MAESIGAFVARRKPSWEALAAVLDHLAARKVTLSELEQLELLSRRAAADLAHAQSFFPGTEAHRYLNQLCSRAYAAVYRDAGSSWARLRRFYAVDFPRTVRAELPLVGLSTFVFLVGLVAGVAALAFNPEAAQLLVPQEQRDFVARGELWTNSALSHTTPSELATSIFLNNLSVCLRAFAFGITFGLGTVVILAFNGVFIGAVVTHCLQNGVGPGILEFMCAHGPVELSVIMLSGAAGLALAQAMVAPGELPRAEALRLRGRAAVTLALGCAPVLVGIGIVEGFVSPGALFPLPAKLAIGAVTGAAFWSWLLRSGQGLGAPSASASARLG